MAGSRKTTVRDYSVSQAAQRFGMRGSALRYYEQIGLLPPAARSGGQRRYDEPALRRLAVLHRARQLGFTLQEIQILFFDLSNSPPISDRWRELSDRKLVELEEKVAHIRSIQEMLARMSRCRCAAFEECGARILSNSGVNPPGASGARECLAECEPPSSFPAGAAE